MGINLFAFYSLLYNFFRFVLAASSAVNRFFSFSSFFTSLHRDKRHFDPEESQKLYKKTTRKNKHSSYTTVHKLTPYRLKTLLRLSPYITLTSPLALLLSFVCSFCKRSLCAFYLCSLEQFQAPYQGPHLEEKSAPIFWWLVSASKNFEKAHHYDDKELEVPRFFCNRFF